MKLINAIISFRLTSFFMAILLLSLNLSCEDIRKSEERAKTKKKSGPKDGLIKTFYENGNVRAAVSYKVGIKHGVSTSYHESGTKKLVMPYVEGQRSGVSEKYYTNGKIYAETPYVNDQITGIRKTYYSNGKKKAETPYKYSLIGVGTIEYSTKESILPAYSLSIRKVNKGNYEVSTSKQCKKTTFFEGELFEGVYLDESEVIALPTSNGNGIYELEGYETNLNFICKCITTGGNTVIINKTTKV